MRYFITIGGEEIALDLSERPRGGYRIKLVGEDSEPVQVDVCEHPMGWTVLIGQRVLDIIIDGKVPNLSVQVSGRRLDVIAENRLARAAAASTAAHPPGGPSIVQSPMPGKVIKVLVDKGASVEKGTSLLVVEAMKMENEICAERGGTVTELFVKTGDAVEAGARLAAIS